MLILRTGVTLTFLRAWLVLRPHPRPSVFITSVSAYRRLVKHWFSHLSPAGQTWRRQQQQDYGFSSWFSNGFIVWVNSKTSAQTCGWHSYCSMRFRHWESTLQGCSSVGLQLHLVISDKSATCICTFPTGLLDWHNKWHPHNKVRHQGLNYRLLILSKTFKGHHLDEFVGRRFARVAFLL